MLKAYRVLIGIFTYLIYSNLNTVPLCYFKWKFLKNISDLPLAALMIHGRTLKQGFSGAPDYKLIKNAQKYFSGLILANGAINNLAEARNALKESQADGLGLARGVLGRPWLFEEIKKDQEISLELKQIFKLMIASALLVQKLKGKPGLIELRKHLPWYLTNQPGASKLREKIVKINTLADLKKILKESPLNK